MGRSSLVVDGLLALVEARVGGHDGLGEAPPARVAVKRLALPPELAHLAELAVEDRLIRVVVVELAHTAKVTVWNPKQGPTEEEEEEVESMSSLHLSISKD